MNNNTIFLVIYIVTGEFNILIPQKYSFQVCVISFGLYSTSFKFYIHLPCMKTQNKRTATFNINSVISYNYSQATRLYQGSANFSEGDFNSDIIHLLHQYHTIHYCNQLVLAIIPDLTIFFWSITIFDIISRSTLVQLCLLRASYLYNLTRLACYVYRV